MRDDSHSCRFFGLFSFASFTFFFVYFCWNSFSYMLSLSLFFLYTQCELVYKQRGGSNICGVERRLCCASHSNIVHLDSEFNVDNDKGRAVGVGLEDTGVYVAITEKRLKLTPQRLSFSPQRSTNVHFSLSLHYLILQHPSHEKVNTE